MAADLKEKLGTASQAFTLTIASLTNNSARQSTPIDNTTNLFFDVLVSLKIKSAAASTSSTGYILVYAFGSVDGGTTYTESAGASDASITLVNPTNLRFLGSGNVVANATTYNFGPFPLSDAYRVVPASWGIVIVNKTGATLDSTGGNHSAQYQGIYAQST